MERQTLSIMKACEVVGVSRRTIYNWIAADKVEYVRTAGGSIRIFADSLWRDAVGAAAAAASQAAAGPTRELSRAVLPGRQGSVRRWLIRRLSPSFGCCSIG